jgi:O-antigen/teichoic acid export membrane protein
MIAPFVFRYYSHKKFFTRDLKAKLAEHHITRNEIKETFDVLWYNSKKLGINFIGAYGINKSSMFIAGLYLSLTDIGTYGIMTQLVTIVSTISCSMFATYLPMFNKLRAQGDNANIVRLFSFNMVVFYVIYIAGILAIILFGPWVLRLIGSSIVLPCTGILVVYSVIILLENNHSNFASLITTNNEVPFVKAGLLSGVVIVALTLFVLNVTSWGLWGIVIVQGVVQLAYNNWYWPRWIFNELHFDVCSMLKCGITESLKKVKLLW